MALGVRSDPLSLASAEGGTLGESYPQSIGPAWLSTLEDYFEASRPPNCFVLLTELSVHQHRNTQPPDKRLQVRQHETLPKLLDLRLWMDSVLAATSGKSELARTILYSAKRWDALVRFAHDGLIEIDNNAAERALRCVALGRKNYLFMGSDVGGERAAAMYSLIGTAKLNGVDSQAYMRHVFERIAEHPVNQVDALLPWNVAAQLAPDAGLRLAA